MTLRPSILALPALAALLLVPLARAQSLETYVLVAGGDSVGPGCSTFAVPPEVSAFFGSAGIGLPLPGPMACNIASDQRSTSAPTGPLVDGLALAPSWGGNALDGSTQVSARQGFLSARALSNYSGGSSGITVKGAEGFAKCFDSFTITSPSLQSGQLGRVSLVMRASGALSTNGSGTTDIELAYRVDTTSVGTVTTLFRAQANNAINLPFVIAASGNDLSGFLLAPGAMAGSGVLASAQHQITMGTSFDLRICLFAYTLPGLTSVTSSDFRARLLGFRLYDSFGQPVTDFTVTSASGATYGPRSGWTPAHNRVPFP